MLDLFEEGTSKAEPKESPLFAEINPRGEPTGEVIYLSDSQTPLLLNDLLNVSFYTPIILTFPSSCIFSSFNFIT